MMRIESRKIPSFRRQPAWSRNRPPYHGTRSGSRRRKPAAHRPARSARSRRNRPARPAPRTSRPRRPIRHTRQGRRHHHHTCPFPLSQARAGRRGVRARRQYRQQVGQHARPLPECPDPIHLDTSGHSSRAAQARHIPMIKATRITITPPNRDAECLDGNRIARRRLHGALKAQQADAELTALTAVLHASCRCNAAPMHGPSPTLGSSFRSGASRRGSARAPPGRRTRGIRPPCRHERAPLAAEFLPPAHAQYG
jgi:hypothetical protein